MSLPAAMKAWVSRVAKAGSSFGEAKTPMLSV